MDWLLNAGTSNPGIPLPSILLSLLLGCALGQVIGWVYMWTHVSPSYSKSFTSSLVTLPVIVSLMMILMAGSTAIAFGLLAVFAVVRFRNVLKDTRDTTYVLWSIVSGMGVGTMHYVEALAGLVVVSLMMCYLRVSDFGGRHQYDAILSLDLTSMGGDIETHLNALLDRHATKWKRSGDQHLTQRGTTVAYKLLLRNPDRSDELRRDLVDREDVEQVSLYVTGDQAET